VFHAKKDRTTNANAHLAHLQAQPTSQRFCLQKSQILANARIENYVMSIEKIDIPEPYKIHRISNTDLLLGKPVPPLKRLQQIDEDTYEEIVLCWAKEYIEDKYETAMQLGGSGDKGRDVCGYIDFKSDVFDLYQCKHYSKQLTYATIGLEFAKLIYYTYSEHYSIPQKYYLVSPQGISPSLLDLIKKPTNLIGKLVKDWNNKFKGKITKKEDDSLTPELEEYIKKFDFSIIYSLEPVDFLAQFQKTSYYPFYFGGGLNKRRNSKVTVSENIEKREINYVTQLYEAYQDYSKVKVETVKDISENQELKTHFDRSRNCFYMAETLAQFSRDHVPSELDAFEELKEEVYEQVVDVCNLEYKDGYNRLLATTNSAKSATFQSNALFPEVKTQDKTGICHHLANEHKLKWVKK
jgi:hypothetical protein